MIKLKDIIVIGGGASGMLAAIKAKENNPQKSVAILEKQSRIGRKLLSTGNGRCNLVNTEITKEAFHGSFKKYLDTTLTLCPASRVIDEFENLGLLVNEESEGRVYPISNHASSVLDVLRFRLSSLGVEIFTDEAVKELKKNKKSFTVTTDKNRFECEKLIIATGSCASPGLGSDKSGVSAVERLGIKTIPFSPALCPIKVNSEYLARLKGVRASCKVTLIDGGRRVKEETGEIQFTENALSGICVFNLSSPLKNAQKPGISIDLAVNYSFIELYNILQKNKKLFSNRTAEDLLTGIFNKKLATVLIKASGIKPLSKRIGSLTENELKRLANLIKDFRFKPEINNDFKNAQVAAGGVSADELDPNTMESLRIKNLYVTGEAVDIDGNCGGYNLWFAFASGIIAGDSV